MALGTTRGRITRREEAVIQAEMRRLARALQPYRVLSREALKRAAGAEKWHEGCFERALQAAVRSGKVKALPAGFYEQPREDAESSIPATAAETGRRS